MSTPTPTMSRSGFDFAIVHKPGAMADITISNAGITRNEMRKGDRVYGKHEKLPSKVDLFDPKFYCAIRDLNENMTRVEKSKFFEEKTFELVIDRDVLLKGCEKGDSKDVIRQLVAIKTQVGKIQKLIIVLDIPNRAEITTFEEYDASDARTQLSRVVAALGFFTALKSLDIVLSLRGKVKKGLPDVDKAWPYIFPFYELDSFKDWSIKRRHNGGPICKILKENVGYFNRQSRKYCVEQARTRRNGEGSHL